MCGMAGQVAPVPGGVPWQRVLEQAAGPVAALDLQAHIVYVNPALCRLLGYSRDYLLQHPPRDVTHPDDVVIDGETIAAMIAGREERFETEKRLLHADGGVVWTVVSSTLIRDVEGRPCFFLSQFHDISARREAELLWRRTVEHAPIGMALLDLQGRWIEVNDALCRLLGYPRAELLGRHVTERTYPDDQQPGGEVLAELLDGRCETVNLEHRYRHREGYPIWVLLRISVVPGLDDRPAYLISQYEAIGGERMRDSHLARMALHDPLTGLANRALLVDRLEQGCAKLADHEVLAVLLADLDNLKPINDRYGHVVGDQILRTAADAMLQTVRPGDTVARYGGDEFAILACVPDLAAAEILRERITDRLQTEVTLSDHSLRMSASVGLATTRDPTAPTEDLLHSADRDMYHRKNSSTR